jgi:class 3 adenylate cyclase
MRIADGGKPTKRRINLNDNTRWVLILFEFLAAYAVFYISFSGGWQSHIYLRFLMIIPLFHAGAAFGYTGSIISSLINIFMFVPIIPIAARSSTYDFDPTSAVIILLFYMFFGIFVGGTVGKTRKTSRYVDTLSQVFMRILAEPDEASIIRRSCEEAAALTDAAGGAALVCSDGEPEPGNCSMSSVFSQDPPGEESVEPPPDNILLWCARANALISTNSAGHDKRLSIGPRAAHVKSALAVPVSFESSVYGSFLLMDKKNDENFSDKDMSIAKAIAETAGSAIHNIVQEKESQQEKLREEQMRELFSRFVSSSVADYVLERPGLLKGRWEEVTVLVSDIKDFTVISERVTPKELVSQLNEYFTAMVDVIFDNKGTIDKFIGDCIIAYWGAPAPDPEHAARAIKAAGEMSLALESLNSDWERRSMTPLSSGIAIHTCKALIGNLGDERKKTFTIMGEEVEKAVKMESLSRTLNEKTIISESAAEASNLSSALAEIPDSPPEFGRLFSISMERT